MTDLTTPAPASNVRAVVHVPDTRRKDGSMMGAVVIGALVGAGVAWLLRRGPDGTRAIDPALDATGRGMRRAWRRGRAAAAELPFEDGRALAEDARDRVLDAFNRELRALRRVVRRQRRAFDS